MAHAIVICYRNPDFEKQIFSADNIDKLSGRIIPDNIEPNPPKVVRDTNIVTIILNPVSSVLTQGSSVCLGALLKPHENWWKPNAEIPEGSFALFRGDSEYVELITDTCASRTIWYIQTDSLFIASSSHRAIVHFLRDFQPSTDALLWMITSGCLGPGFSWDKRIEALKPDSRLIFHRSLWKLDIQTNPAVFRTKKQDWKSAKESLLNELYHVFENLELDFSKWALPLSGGYDSRAILYFLRDKTGMRCVTWGATDSLKQELNDAQVAKAVAEYFHFRHTYFPTDLDEENVPASLERFIYASEGRSDQVAAYTDGLRMWKRMFDEGIEGVIRGDEIFGHFFVSSELEANYRTALTTYEHFHNLCYLVENTADIFQQQYIPEWFQRSTNESPATWRDRLYQTYRIPNYLGGAHALKSAYVEVINPYLSKGIATFVRTLPDKFRSEKPLFKEIVNELISCIPISKFDSLDEYEDILRNDQIASYIVEILTENRSKNILPEPFVEHILSKLESDGKVKTRSLSVKDVARRVLPKQVKVALRNKYRRDLDYYRLAFRVFIAFRANQMFVDDARAFSN